MFEGNFVKAKTVASGGYLHPLQAPFGAARTYRVGLVSRRVQHRRNIGYCIQDSGKEDDMNQRDALMIDHALNSLIGINRN
jgi:hypothetical protein